MAVADCCSTFCASENVRKLTRTFLITACWGSVVAGTTVFGFKMIDLFFAHGGAIIPVGERNVSGKEAALLLARFGAISGAIGGAVGGLLLPAKIPSLMSHQEEKDMKGALSVGGVTTIGSFFLAELFLYGSHDYDVLPPWVASRSFGFGAFLLLVVGSILAASTYFFCKTQVGCLSDTLRACSKICDGEDESERLPLRTVSGIN